MADPLTADELVGAILDLHLPTLTRQLGAVGIASGADGDAFEVTGVRSSDGRFVVLTSPGLADYVEQAEAWRTELEEHVECATIREVDRERREHRRRIRELETELHVARAELERLRASGP